MEGTDISEVNWDTLLVGGVMKGSSGWPTNPVRLLPVDVMNETPSEIEGNVMMND